MFFRSELNTIAKVTLLSATPMAEKDSMPVEKTSKPLIFTGLLSYLTIVLLAILGACLVAHYSVMIS